MSAVTTALKRVFGFDELRPGQGEVIEEVLAGEPVIAVMPTGAGKSLCYQLPAVLLAPQGGVTLVVSPLIALMKDQVDSLAARNVPAAALTSAIGWEEQAEVLAGVRAGAYALVFVAPERFRSPRFLDALAELGDRLALLAIDEAHCISEWGHDFRPDYRRLGEVVRALRPPRLIALTATATPEVRDDIAAQLGIEHPRMHVRGFDRPNLYYAVERVGGPKDKGHRIAQLVRERGRGTALVYAATRKNAERYSDALRAAGLRARVYHAGLDDDARHDAQDAFMAGKLDAIVATNAFGMGVDKADIRVVVHADLPRSPEAYYQEAGRGGRDGDPTTCVLLFNHGDVRLQEFLIDATYPSGELLRALWKLLREQPERGMGAPGALAASLPGTPHESTVKSALRLLARHGLLRDDQGIVEAVRPGELGGDYPALDVEALARREQVERSKLRRMIDYAYHPRCRRQFVLDYFGDEDWRDGALRCAGCDNCRGVGQTQALSEEQTWHARALLAVVDALPGRFGRTRLAAIANGTDDDPRFDGLPERGLLRGQPAAYLMDLLRSLEGAGAIEVSRGDYPTLSLSRAGRAALAAGDDLGGMAVAAPARRAAGARRRAAAPAVSDEPIDEALVDRLRQWRTSKASEKAVPAYVIFSNRTLEALARSRPSSLDELAAVHGIGQSRLDAYGEELLAAIKD